jgi:hypothetical protein
MKTTVELQESTESTKGQTLLLKTSTRNSSIQIPKQINWKDIRLPNQWLLENLVPLPKVENNASSNLSYTTQKTDGTIGISFQPCRKIFFPSIRILFLKILSHDQTQHFSPKASS